jgi:tRNA threonylcarbamoyladenosine biosynthesis protein TsaE
VLRAVTNGPEETKELGTRLASQLPQRGVTLLIGDLGAGKTTLAKGIVEGLGVAPADEVTSPTYTIIHEYGDPTRVYHVDLYRLDTEEEVTALGFDELLERDALILIEWGERFPRLLPEHRIEIALTPDEEDRRVVVVTGLERL